MASGVLVTAWHVLEGIQATNENVKVQVDPLEGGGAFGAWVRRLDPIHDLAVLTSGTSLPESAGSFANTDRVQARTEVTVIGSAVPDDRASTYRFVRTVGTWVGGTTWGNSVPLGRVIADKLVPGMAGAPVIHYEDNVVAGVVSGRYNSADGWPPQSVWVAPTGVLVSLLDGIADVVVEREGSNSDAIDLVLTVTSQEVRLAGSSVDVSAAHGGVRPGLVLAIEEVQRNRIEAGLIGHGDAFTESMNYGAALCRVGRLLAESFLPGAVAGEFARVLREADRAHVPVRVGLVLPPELAGLPWEALAEPCDELPLALHPLITVYRRVDAGEVGQVPGPLRIMVAIAAPDGGGGGVLDYEQELRNVIASVRTARQGAAHVRIVPFASPAAVYSALDEEPVHVLHVSAHGSPGSLDLENDDGTLRRVTAEEFSEEAIPPGKTPPVIALSACYTDATAVGGGPSFAATLCQRGAQAVIATQTTITDRYATRMFARLYGKLAYARVPDVVAALADARREVQDGLRVSAGERDRGLAALDEWAVVTVLAASGSIRLFTPDISAPAPVPSPRREIPGLVGRDTGYFVGRRAEQRHWPRELVSSPYAGLVIHGTGGIGKTTLAAEIIDRVMIENTDRALITLAGQITIERLLAAVTATLRRSLQLRDQHAPDTAVQALTDAARVDLGWEDRFALLREQLDRVPLLVVLDNFEDNLDPAGSQYAVRDEIVADLLAAWVSSPGASRLLITSRFGFTLPGGTERLLSFRPVGPLTLAETMKLAWSLPTLDHLDEAQIARIWRLVGGHPRSLEYLDALLSGRSVQYGDVAARLTTAVASRLAGVTVQEWLATPGDLDAALAEVASLASDDVLLDALLGRLRQLSGAEDLLLGMSVYREPVGTNAMLFQAGQPDKTAAYVPDRAAADKRIVQILGKVGITAPESFDAATITTPEVQAQLAPHFAEILRLPHPAFRSPPVLPQLIQACQATGLLSLSGNAQDRLYFVHRWTATELASRAARDSDPKLSLAHRRAAAYWRWHAQVWLQDQSAFLHDLFEARHHLHEAGDIEEADQLSGTICEVLHNRGALDAEFSLIDDIIGRHPRNSPTRAMWAFRHGRLAQERGDYARAEREYRQALGISEHLGDQSSIATDYHQLGRLARVRGNYTEAWQHYRRALEIWEGLGDQSGMAHSYHEMGILADLVGNRAEGEQCYQRALQIRELLGDEAGMAASFGQLAWLAQLRGNYAEAERGHKRAFLLFEHQGDQTGMATSRYHLGILAQMCENYTEAVQEYWRAIEIFQRIGNQAGMAVCYNQLGSLAMERGDYEEAGRQCRRSLEISERIGSQASVAVIQGHLGKIALECGDLDEAERRYRRSIEICDRLGDQSRAADCYSNVGIIEAARDSVSGAIECHVKALAIRLALGKAEINFDLRQLGRHRTTLGTEKFTVLLTSATGDAERANTIMALLHQANTAAADNFDV